MKNIIGTVASFKNSWLYFGDRGDGNFLYKVGNWKEKYHSHIWNKTTNKWQRSLPNDDFDKIYEWKEKPIFFFPYISWISSSPEWIIKIISKFIFFRLYLLQALAINSSIKDIFKNSPAFFLISLYIFTSQNKTPEQFAEIMSKKRKEILKLANLPFSKSFIRTLSIIIPQKYDKSEAENILKILKSNKAISLIKNIKSISSSYIPFLLSLESKRLNPLMENIILNGINEKLTPFRIKHKYNVARRLRADTLAMVRELNRQNALDEIRNITSEKETIETHDRWLNVFLLATTAVEQPIIDTQSVKQHLSPSKRSQYPEPLLGGTKDIIPIRNIMELREEGRQMHNCVATFNNKIKNHICDIYKITSPERATLEIKRNFKNPKIGQLNGPNNSTVSHHLRQLVKDWFNYQLSKINNNNQIPTMKPQGSTTKTEIYTDTKQYLFPNIQ